MKRVCKKKELPRCLTLFAWLNIGVQATVPIFSAFAPALVHAAEKSRFLTAPAGQATLDTKVYTLSAGESTASVARQYHMDINQLRKLNQFRTFARGFDHLQAGDELEVPLAPLPAVEWRDDPQALALPSQDNAQAHKIASLAASAGAFLGNNDRGEAAAAMGRGMAASVATAEAQQWLSQFGTARIQLDVDSRFSLKTSQLDMLVPLHDQQKTLIFTQGSLHRTDDRTQSNLGLGLRWFNDGYMLGGNTFLDYDLSRDHARIGMGVEYWRDFLKLGANSYLRLTNWKDTPDVADYQERPANGWDMRVEGWLPALPQLGANLLYEQYYGKEVALFGKDNRQRDPHALTLGINYTPFPLLTLSAERRQGKAGENDTRIGLQMNIQLGQTWRAQMDPGAVGAMRQLAGSRYDLVERNNNIILEYRKKDVIFLSIVDRLAGYAGEQKSLNVSVNSKYGLERIDWAAPALLAAGGRIVQEDVGNVSVVLPDYQFDAPGGNVYEISGVAIDTHGNVSRRAKTILTVIQPAINDTTSEFTPAVSTLPADNASRQTLVLKIRDAQGNPIDIDENEISVTTDKEQEKSGATVSALQRHDVGTFTMEVTAGTGTDVVKLTPHARNVTFASATVTIAADNTTAQIKRLLVVDDNAAADGEETNKVKVTVVDAFHNPVPDLAVSFSADNNTTVTASAITDAAGEAVAEVTSLQAGETTVTAALANTATKTVKTTFVSDNKSAMIAALKVVQDGATADGQAENQLMVSVTDANGNPIQDRQVQLQAEKGVQLSAKSVTTDNQGIATFSAVSTASGTFNVTATTNGHRKTAPIAFVAGEVESAKSSLTADKTIIASDGNRAIPLSFTARDRYDNAVTGLKVEFVQDGLEGQLSAVNEQNGVYTASFTATKPGLGTLGVAVNGNRLTEIQSAAVGVYAQSLALTFDVSS